jgi:hypothetical protein
MRKEQERVIREAMRWAFSMEVGMDLSKMGAPDYLCGATPEAIHRLFKACAALAKRKAK